ncbi:hypothetical protein [Actinomadura flavalba]|uniref:hypothetical protein n=1 Tax=Actinomadura flavalba TaxID=1120938 RepID=UPI00037F9AFE|nr:hypothetical protein [Actinomadura flavalba]
MSSDLVALVRRQPDVEAVADGMIAMGEPLELRGGDTAPALLFDRERRLLVSIEEPVLVSVPGEIARLLGPDVAGRVTAPVWWVEIRAAGDVPEAARVARRFAEDLVRWAGGTVYPDGISESPARSWRAADAPREPHPQGSGNVIR